MAFSGSSIVRGAAKGATTAADVTSTAQSVDRQALDVQIRTSSGAVVDTFGTTGGATAAAQTDGTQKTQIVQGGNTATVTASSALKVDPSAVTQPISAASLPLPAGAATSAKQPALGTAGSPSVDVISVQGVGSGTPIPVSSSTLALDATLTGGTAKAIVRGGAKGATSAADVTSTASGASHQALDAILYDAAGNPVTTTKGVQVTPAIQVQDLKDGGRTYIVLHAEAIASVAAEAMVTFVVNKGGTETAGQTQYTVTAGKTLRIQYIHYCITGTAAFIVSQMRVRSAGTVGIASPILYSARAQGTNNNASTGQSTCSPIPEGLEIAAGQQVCFSHLGAAGNVESFLLIGYEY